MIQRRYLWLFTKKFCTSLSCSYRLAAITIKLLNPELFTYSYQRVSYSLAASLMAFLENIILSECVSEYASFKSGYISKSTFALCLWLSGNLSCRLKKQVSAACKQLLWCVPFVSTMWVYVFSMHLALSLLSVSAWIASHLRAMRIS